MLCAGKDLSYTSIPNDFRKWLMKLKVTGCFDNISFENIDLFALVNNSSIILFTKEDYVQFRVIENNGSYSIRIDSSMNNLPVESAINITCIHESRSTFKVSNPYDYKLSLKVPEQEIGGFEGAFKVSGIKYRYVTNNNIYMLTDYLTDTKGILLHIESEYKLMRVCIFLRGTKFYKVWITVQGESCEQ